MDVDSECFFAELPEIRDFQDVVTASQHHAAPGDWQIVITDVRGSTRAIEAGRYKDVNALGVASIIGLRNALSDVDIPYVFGGDGATLLVPESRLVAVDRALRGLRELAVTGFDLELRVARVAVAELKARGCKVNVGRYRVSPDVALAAFSGDGFSLAEEWIKDPVSGGCLQVSAEGESEVDLEGFECRWRPVKAKRGNMVSLLVVATSSAAEDREATYHRVLATLRSINGATSSPPFGKRHLRLRAWTGDYSTEAKTISKASGEGYEQARARIQRATLLGRGLLALRARAGTFDGKSYRDEFLQNTDFRKFDEALRMVIDLTPIELQQLSAFLEALHAEGRLAFGIHVSKEALITCMIKSYSGDHVHFIDGADGGYALAAKPLKEQLKSMG